MDRRRFFSAALQFILITLSSLPAAPADAGDPDPSGIWMRGDGNAEVDIRPCVLGGDLKLCATNVWIRDSSNGEAIGDKLIMTIRPSADNVLVGEAYDPKRDRSYTIKVTVGQQMMTTRGCVFLGLLCKTVTWSKVRL